MKGRMAKMTKDMAKLYKLLQTAAVVPPTSQPDLPPPEPLCKKRRVSATPSPVSSLAPPEPLPVTSLPDAASAALDDALLPIPEVVPPMPVPSKIATVSSTDFCSDSLDKLSPVDEDILTSLFSLDDIADEEAAVDLDSVIPTDDMEVPEVALSLPISGPSVNSEIREPLNAPSEPADPRLVEKMQQALSKLPKNLQELFVERLVALTTHPDAFATQVQAVNALANAASAQANKLQVLEEAGKDTEPPTELATAILGAFLSRYGSKTSSSPVSTLGNVPHA